MAVMFRRCLKCRERKKCLGDRIECGVSWVNANIWKCFWRQGRVWSGAVSAHLHTHMHTLPQKDDLAAQHYQKMCFLWSLLLM